MFRMYDNRNFQLLLSPCLRIKLPHSVYPMKLIPQAANVSNYLTGKGEACPEEGGGGCSAYNYPPPPIMILHLCISASHIIILQHFTTNSHHLVLFFSFFNGLPCEMISAINHPLFVVGYATDGHNLKSSA